MQQKRSESFYTVAILIVTLLWGIGFIVTVEALAAGYSESFILMVRFLMAAVAFWFICRKEISTITRNELIGGIIAGFLLFLGFALQTFALPLTTPSNNAILTASNIVIVPFFVWIIFKKKPLTKMFVGALICFIGIIIISVDVRNLSSFNLGDFLTFLCAIAFAMHTSSMGYFAVHGRPKVLNFIQMTVAGIFSVILFVIQDSDLTQFIPRIDMVWVLYLAVFSTIIAYFVQTSAIKHLNPSRVAIITAGESVVASVISIVIGYEKLRINLIIGGVLVIASMLLVEINTEKLKQQRKA